MKYVGGNGMLIYWIFRWLITSGILIGVAVALATPIVWGVAILLAVVGLIRDLSK